MRALLFIPVLVGIALTACKKVPLEPNTTNISGDPMFFTELSINGNETSIVVGENAELVSESFSMGDNSFVSSVLNDAFGNSLLELELVLPGELSTHSFDDPVAFTFYPQTDYTIHINDLMNGASVTNGSWHMLGQNVGSQLHINEMGVYDIDLEINELSGLVTNLVLKDRLVVGGNETNEPDFEINNIVGNLYTPVLLSTPPEVDEVRWYTGSDYFGDKLYFDPNTGIEVLFDYAVITCEFYAQNELVNVKSELVTTPFLGPGTLLETSHDLTLLTSGSIVNQSFGVISCLHNGDYYSTALSPLEPTITFSNVHTEIEAVTGHEYVIATIHFDSNLMNANGESIHVLFSGDFGFKKSPP